MFDTLPRQARLLSVALSFLLPAAQSVAQLAPLPGQLQLSDQLLFDDPVLDPDVPPVEPDPSQLLAPRHLIFSQRWPSQMSFTFHDRTEAELGYDIRRAFVGQDFEMPSNADWEIVAELGPQTGFVTFADSGLEADRMYCYRVWVIGATRELPSELRCAYTRPHDDDPVFRLQVGLNTGEIANAGTNDQIQIRLNSAALVHPFGNRSWLNYSRDDFEPGDTQWYDLGFDHIRTESDVTQVRLEKFGDDDYCLRSLSLRLNGRSYFSQDFSGEPDGCTWINADSDNQLTIPFSELRADPNWGMFNPMRLLDRDTVTGLVDGSAASSVPDPNGGISTARDWTINFDPEVLGIDGESLRSRIEAVIGHEMREAEIPHGGRASWRAPSSGEASSIQMIRLGLQSIFVSFTIDVDGLPLGFEPVVDGHFKLNMRFECLNQNNVRLRLSAQDVTLEAETFWNILEQSIQDELDNFNLGFNFQRSLELEGLDDFNPPATCHAASLFTTVVEKDVFPTLILRQNLQEGVPGTGDASQEPGVDGGVSDGGAAPTGPASPDQ